MKLSEAIRLGAMLGPQCYRTARSGNATCALQAAAEACGLDESDVSNCHVDDPIRDAFPILGRYVNEPEIILHAMPLYEVIWILNDDYKWSREQIADWVETIERAQEQPQAAEMSTLA